MDDIRAEMSTSLRAPAERGCVPVRLRGPIVPPHSEVMRLTRETPGPVAPASRIVEVDIVRGFALFGVLLVNMYGFGADSIAWDSPIDRLAFAITRVFFESKSWTLFSILFGFGFALQLQGAEKRGARILPMYLRRLTVLFAIGAAHALLFDGDILMLYAELGLGLLVVHRVPTRWLLVLAVGLMFVFPLAHLADARPPTLGVGGLRKRRRCSCSGSSWSSATVCTPSGPWPMS